MRFAVTDEQVRITAQPGARALCPGCAAPVLAKCGAVKIWHWAHLAAEGCDWEPAGMTDWHLQWQDEAPEDRQEIAMSGHRADVVSPSGVIVEMQHSHLSKDKIKAREKAYKRMVWLFDAREARAEERIVFRRHPDRDFADLYVNLKWTHAPAFVGQVSAPLFLDLDDKTLFWLNAWYHDSPRQGHGWIVTREWFCREVINGRGIPRKPRGQTAFTDDDLAMPARLEHEGDLPCLNWSSHRVLKPSKPCRICLGPAMMTDADGQACHKVCAEEELADQRDAEQSRPVTPGFGAA